MSRTVSGEYPWAVVPRELRGEMAGHLHCKNCLTRWMAVICPLPAMIGSCPCGQMWLERNFDAGIPGTVPSSHRVMLVSAPQSLVSKGIFKPPEQSSLYIFFKYSPEFPPRIRRALLTYSHHVAAHVHPPVVSPSSTSFRKPSSSDVSANIYTVYEPSRTSRNIPAPLNHFDFFSVLAFYREGHGDVRCTNCMR